jgi:hypothetical protein
MEAELHSITVIPAQAGTQQSKNFAQQTKPDVPLRGGFFNSLDSRLRGNDGL